MKFSSQARYVPHGVSPLPQLFQVPSVRVPVGSASVLSRSEPAAGPVISISVSGVMRRLNGLSTTTDQPSSPSAISNTETPCASIPLRMSSSLAAFPSGRLPQMIPRFVYSLLTAKTTRPSELNKAMPSLLSPNASSWLAAVPRVSWSNSGPLDQSGSPQLTSVFQSYPPGTTMVSAVPAGIWANPNRSAEASARDVSAVVPNRKLPRPNVTTPPMNPRRLIADSMIRSRSVTSGRGE